MNSSSKRRSQSAGPPGAMRHAFEEGLHLVVHPVERQEVAHRRGPRDDAKRLREHERLGLRGERQRLLVPLEVKWLHAEAVARAEQLAARSVPQREREHAVEALEAARTPAPVGGEDHLGVAGAREPIPQRLELGAQLDVVVDLTVVRDPGAGLGPAHRLVAGRREVDDRKPSMREPDREVGVPSQLSVRSVRGVREAAREHFGGGRGPAQGAGDPRARVDQDQAFVVRAAMAQQIRHALESPEIDAPRDPVQARDAAHGRLVTLRSRPPPGSARRHRGPHPPRAPTRPERTLPRPRA